MVNEEKYKRAALYQAEHKCSIRKAALSQPGISYTGFWAWQKKQKSLAAFEPVTETKIVVHDVTKKKPGRKIGYKAPIPVVQRAPRDNFVFVGRVSDLKALLKEMGGV